MHRTGTKRICLPRVQILVKCLPTIDVSFQLSIVGIGSSLTTIFRSSATIAESLLKLETIQIHMSEQVKTNEIFKEQFYVYIWKQVYVIESSLKVGQQIQKWPKNLKDKQPMNVLEHIQRMQYLQK